MRHLKIEYSELYLICGKRSIVARKRSYDVARRAEQARQGRERILEVARAELLSRGYVATTMRLIAERAGLSAETVYKAFGGKPGLIRAIYEKALAGRGPVPAPRRSEAMVARARGPQEVAREWGRLTAEVSPLASPILLLLRSAAADDPELAALLRQSDDQRLQRMRFNARSIARRGFLRPGISVERAADLLWALTAPELYELFVVRRGFSAKKLGELVGAVIASSVVRDG
jgi:AcrR family transcriptional regulator